MTTKRSVANTIEEICPHVILYIKHNTHIRYIRVSIKGIRQLIIRTKS